MKYKHADNMLAYAQDAQETETPWKLWEYSNGYSGGWNLCNSHPAWSYSAEYRRKTRTIRIGNYDVPEPLRVAPEEGALYYMASFGVNSAYDEFRYDGGPFDCRVLKRGMMHLTREAAELHAKALISLTEQ